MHFDIEMPSKERLQKENEMKKKAAAKGSLKLTSMFVVKSKSSTTNWLVDIFSLYCFLSQ